MLSSIPATVSRLQLIFLVPYSSLLQIAELAETPQLFKQTDGIDENCNQIDKSYVSTKWRFFSSNWTQN